MNLSPSSMDLRWHCQTRNVEIQPLDIIEECLHSLMSDAQYFFLLVIFYLKNIFRAASLRYMLRVAMEFFDYINNFACKRHSKLFRRNILLRFKDIWIPLKSQFTIFSAKFTKVIRNPDKSFNSLIQSWLNFNVL